METFSLALLLLAAVLVSSVIDQLVPKVSSPLIQIALGLVIALLTPSQVSIGLDPELFLVLFIAPLLYDEAKRADKTALWHNRKPVLSLAIGLVFATALIIGFAVHAVIPSIPLAAAFALGAALGPTDAVAVASLSKETAIPERQKSILKGESLINDASGIVSFQFALAAAITGTFSLFDASLDFLISFFGGLFFGALLGWAGNLLVRWVRNIGLENTTFHVLFEVLTPFIVYLVGEALGASGIIAVVTAGLVNVISPRSIGPSISRMNIVSTSVWRVLSFGLNGIVFVLLGTQLPKAMERTWEDVHIDNLTLFGYVVGLTFLLLLIRFIWVLVMEKMRDHATKEKRALKTILKSALTITLAGSKGTITLAVLFTIPVYTSFPATFPQRDLIIFLACGVILCTFLLATFVVPLLAPKPVRETTQKQQEETECNIEILRNVIEELTVRQTSETRRATRAVIRSYNDRISRIKEKHDIEDEPNLDLRLQVLGWEADYVNRLIDEKEIHPMAGYQYLKRLTHIEQLLKHSTGKWSAESVYLRTRTFVRTMFHSIVNRVPGVTAPKRIEELREVQVKTYEYAIGKLQEMVSEDEVPTEDASALLVEYQRVFMALRSSSPSITAIARASDKTDDIRRLGLQLELEQIQTMYEDERLCRATAKRLRENVNLMQMDLEDNV